MDSSDLATLPLFGALTEDQLERVAAACEELAVEEGTTLVREGDFGHAVFAITAGTADVVHEGAVINTLGRVTTSARSPSCPEGVGPRPSSPRALSCS